MRHVAGIISGPMDWPNFWAPLLVYVLMTSVVGSALAVVINLVLKKRLGPILGVQEETRDSADSAASTAGITNATVTEFKDRFDDVYAALLAERMQEQRVQRVERATTQILEQQQQVLEFMAQLEQERHEIDKAVITGTHFLDGPRP